MRRLFLASAALALVLSTMAGAVSADTSGGCSGATQCRFAGQGVDASWSGAPVDGPIVGQTYTDTYVAASTSMTTTKGTKSTKSTKKKNTKTAVELRAGRAALRAGTDRERR
jgi:hypothetical protein